MSIRNRLQKRMTRLHLEPLELRVAPAVKALSFAATFTEIANGLGNVLLTNDVGYFEDGTTAGQAADGSEPALVKVTGGKALVFLTDLDHDDKFDANEITGLALTDGAKVEVFFDVNGPILTNAVPTATATSATLSNGTAGDVLVNASIASLTVHGNVTGIIAAGRNIANVRIDGVIGSDEGIGGVFTGHALDDLTNSFDFTVSFGASQPMPIEMQEFVTPAGTATAPANGGDVTTLTADGLLGNQPDGPAIVTSYGGSGARGGNITGVTLLHQTSEYVIRAGDGGQSGTAAGGVGGSITTFVQSNGGGDANLSAGNGAEGATIGGAGGSISGVTVTNVIGSFTLSGGTGGTGSNQGGAGGAVKTITVHTNDGDILINSGEGADAANAANTGVGGAGGAVDVLNLSAMGGGNLVSIAAGDGGDGDKRGGAGGSVGSAVTRSSVFAAGEVTVSAGHAGIGGQVDGETTTFTGIGGAGGSLVNLTLSSASSSVILEAGSGGDGLTGGAGGNIIGVDILHSVGVIVNDHTTQDYGDGGNSTLNSGSLRASGGAGGSVTRLHVLNDIGTNPADGTAVSIRSGDGGDGTLNGGAGGLVTSVTVVARHSVALRGGDGGASAGGSGNGGAGGAITGGNIIADGAVSGVAGDGGNGVANGGSGGAITSSVFKGMAGVALTTGDGGDSTSSSSNNLAMGVGGAISSVTISTDPVAVSVVTGNGGDGPRGRNGGDITKLTISAANSVGVVSGDGGDSSLATTGVAGGRGGDIRNLAISRISGSVSIGTGDGGNALTGGRGGNLSNDPLLRLSIQGKSVLAIEAGAGGLGTTATGTGGAGGSVSSLTLVSGDSLTINTTGGGAGGDGSRIGGAGGALTGIGINGFGETADLRAGNGGDATDAASALRGGAGGSVSALTVKGAAYGAVLRDIVAGDGGAANDAAANSTGGVGGNIVNVKVNGRIGNFTEEFGLTSQGGLFAGAGGVGDLTGANGKVTDITATGIASIVAGITVPKPVALIDRITASIVGADLDGDHKLDLIDMGTPGLDAGDTITDGLVLAVSAPTATAFKNFNLQVLSPLYKVVAGTATGTLDPGEI